MPSSVVCRCLSRLMRRCFLGRWICWLVSERLRLVWQCCPFGCNTYIRFCLHWHGGQCQLRLVPDYAVVSLKSFTFSVSNLTVLQFRFLRKGNVVFFSDMILLMVSIFIFFSWVSVCVCVFVVYDSLSCSVWFGLSGFPVFRVSFTVLGVGWCVWLYICLWISSISRSENQIFFVIVLTWSASLWFVALNLPNSLQISIILFLYPLFAGLLQNNRIMLVCYLP